MVDNTYTLSDGTEIKVISKPFCDICSKPISESYTYCNDCRYKTNSIKINAVGLYLKWHMDVSDSAAFCREYPINKAIHKLKKDPRQAEVLGACMVDMINNSYISLKNRDLIVPVPESDLERGFNQAGLLAEYIAYAINIEFKDILRCKEKRPRQEDVPFEKKAENVKGKYECIEDIPGKSVLLIDDVYTTGSTMNECASVLKGRGAREVHGFAFAKEASIKHIYFIKQNDKYL